MGRMKRIKEIGKMRRMRNDYWLGQGLRIAPPAVVIADTAVAGPSAQHVGCRRQLQARQVQPPVLDLLDRLLKHLERHTPAIASAHPAPAAGALKDHGARVS